VNGPVRRLSVAIFSAFFALLAAVTWIQVIYADSLKADQRNPRPALSERGKERGLMVTIDGTVVARSIEDPNSPLSFVREYPEGEAFAHVVGFNSFTVGDFALEGAYAADLRSRRDLTISDLLSVILGQDLRPRSLELTINAELQRAAYEALAGQTGAVVALDPQTGAILASVSSPSFDPQSLLGPDTDETWATLLSNPDNPLADRATREIFAPGSTFKVIVTATALDTGEAGPGTLFPDPEAFELPGSTATITDFGGRLCNDGESVTLLEALVRSCNTVFADLAIRLGASDIGITAGVLGFNQDIEFDWPLPRAVFPVEDLEDDPAALGQSGIGERDVRASPLHMAMVVASIANGGVTPKPFLVNRIFDAEGNTVESTDPVSLGRAMAPATASVLTQMMERVVTEGTGRLAAVPGVRVAGKTGTSQGSGVLPNPWFIGFAPVDDPTIAIAVFIEGGGTVGESATGGSLAAPIASKLIEVWMSASP
jgi:penicillin-binding protein A